MFSRRVRMGILALALAGVVLAARKAGDPLKPGLNLFSKAQDVEVGQEDYARVEATFRQMLDSVRFQ